MEKKRIIAFGDSIVKGVITPDNNSYCITEDNFVQECEQRLGVEVENCSRFGCTVKKGLEIVERSIAKLKNADYAILGWGGNDCAFDWEKIASNPDAEHEPLTSLEDFNSTYKKIIAQVRSEGAEPILLSLPPINSNLYFDEVTRNMSGSGKSNVLKWLGGTTEYIQSWHELYNLEVFKLGSDLGADVVDITSAFLQKRNFVHFLCLDGMHPNEKGHQLIADTLCDYCSRMMPAF